jgi:cation:H+ antiporter
VGWLEPEQWSLALSIGVFLACAAAIGVLGTRITKLADHLADRTGMGEAVAGTILLGAATSLAGTVLSITAAFKGNPDLAVGNALGGIAVQTSFLAVADLVYRQANLEHAAASPSNMVQSSLLIALLALILLGIYSPDVTVWSIHPITVVLIGSYIYGVHIVKDVGSEPRWHAVMTDETRKDEPGEWDGDASLTIMWVRFAGLAAALAVAGYALQLAATGVSSKTGLSQTTMGVLFTSISTSLPELVIAVAAVRRGALTLAVGGIIGGNAYDTLATAFSDIAYRDGSIYHTIGPDLLRWIALTILMIGILAMGLVRRQKQGVLGIGFESFAILMCYIAAVAMLLLT